MYECLQIKLLPGGCERPSVSGLQHSPSSVATIASGGVFSDCDPLLRRPTDGTMATDHLEHRFCRLFQSWRLYLESRPIQLTADEEQARRLAFPELSPRKVFQILNIGVCTTDEAGERLIERGKHIDTSRSLFMGEYACRETNASSSTWLRATL
jgi:hypothetical protein